MSIIPIPTDHRRYVLFLIIQDRVAMVVEYKLFDEGCIADRPNVHKRYFGFHGICPCCLFREERLAIMQAIEQARAEDLFDGKVVWFGQSHHIEQIDDRKYEGLPVGVFRHGTPEHLPLEVRIKVTENALPIFAAYQADRLAMSLTIQEKWTY